MSRDLISVDAAAEAVGVSVRHFRRLSEDAEIDPVEVIRGGHQPKFFWTRDQIESIKRYMDGDRQVSAEKDGLVACPLFEVKIDQEQCQSQCRKIAVNEETCCVRGCPSPYRFCIACLRQGYSGKDSLAINAIKGTCEFHGAHGSAAKRGQANGKEPTVTTTPTIVEGQVVVVDTKKVRPFKDQPRDYFDEDELKALEKSIFKRGQLQPGLVRKISDRMVDFELIDGQRRWHACAALGFPFRAVVVQPKDIEDQFEMSIVSNFQKAEHTPMEIAHAIHRLCKKGGKSEADVAVLMGKSYAWVNQYHRLVNLIPEIQALLSPALAEKDRIPITVASQLSMLTTEEQLPAFNEIKEKKLSAVSALAMIRTSRHEKSVALGGEGIRRKKEPRHQFEIVQNYVRRVNATGKWILQRIGREDASRIFGHRGEQRQQLAADIVEAQRLIQEINVLVNQRATI